MECIELIGLIEFIELKVDSSWLTEYGAGRSDQGARHTANGIGYMV
jgi:hypothetical protein